MADSQNKKLPKGWRMVRFGDVVRDVNEAERNPPGAGLERYVGLEHIEPENLHLKAWGDLTTDEVSFTKRFRKGQVLFGKRRAYQRKVAVAEFDGICSSDILTFEPKDDALLPDLLPFIVQSEGFFEHALGTSSGSLSPRTRWNQLQDYQFPLPPKDEQRRIAEILWASDALRESTIVLIDRLRIARDTLFEGALKDAEMRETCSRTIRLRECCERVTDGTHIPPPFSEEGVPFFLVKTISSGTVDWSHTKFVSQDTYQDLTRTIRPSRGHVLYTVVGATYGVAVLVDFDEPFVFQRHIAHLIPSPEVLDAHFLTFYLNSRAGKRQADQSAIGTAQPTITLRDLGRFQLPGLPLQEQQRLVKMVSRFDCAIAKSEANLDTLRSATRGIVSCALFGNQRPKE